MGQLFKLGEQLILGWEIRLVYDRQEVEAKSTPFLHKGN